MAMRWVRVDNNGVEKQERERRWTLVVRDADGNPIEPTARKSGPRFVLIDKSAKSKTSAKRQGVAKQRSKRQAQLERDLVAQLPVEPAEIAFARAGARDLGEASGGVIFDLGDGRERVFRNHQELLSKRKRVSMRNIVHDQPASHVDGTRRPHNPQP